MKIGPIVQPNYLESYKAPAAPAANINITVENDEIALSEEVRSFSTVLAGVRDAEGLRSPEENARIDMLIQAIRQGDYRVDSEKIAEIMFAPLCGELRAES